MERLRDESGRFRAQTYEVTVWNMTSGGIAYWAPKATTAELDEIEKNYDEPLYEVQVEPND